MTTSELFGALLELAREVDLDVRRVPAADAQTSAVCRLRDRFWVLLSAGDPLEQQVAVLAGALRDHKRETCEARFLPPAVRAALGSDEGL